MSFRLLIFSMDGLFVVAVTKLFFGGANHAASVSIDRFLQNAGPTFVVAILFSAIATQRK